MNNTLLEVNDLKVSFFTHIGEVHAVRNVSFYLKHGEILGVVGESGSGKSVTMKAIMSILQSPGKVLNGNILLNGTDILNMPESDMREIRGNRISMIFQDPMTSLNPTMRIGDQIIDTICAHRPVGRKEAMKEAIELLKRISIPSPAERLKQYPYEFSGGMRQRVMIAIALANSPDLIIADEPTTALDVTIQSQIIDLLKKLQNEIHTSIILITHDLGVIAEMCDRVIVMYGGIIVEEAPVIMLYHCTKHPYTKGLLRSIPSASGNPGMLEPIRGTPPNLLTPPPGCPFYPRCDFSMKICRMAMPKITEAETGHYVRCWHFHPYAPSNRLNGGVIFGK